jgi:hypothetical protein
MSYVPQIGSVSSGTLDPQELIGRLAYELRLCMGKASKNGAHNELIEQAEYPPKEDFIAQSIVDRLIDALDEYAPAGTYFGAHEVVGADFGFWPDDFN